VLTGGSGLASSPAGCGHCKRMTPEFKKLGAMVESDPKLKGRVVIAKASSACCMAACTMRLTSLLTSRFPCVLAGQR
jgi:hypothetical protein